jgi:hypothetical protein
MKVQEVILRAIAKQITWWQAAEIIGISDRQLRRWQRRYEEHGVWLVKLTPGFSVMIVFERPGQNEHEIYPHPQKNLIWSKIVKISDYATPVMFFASSRSPRR